MSKSPRQLLKPALTIQRFGRKITVWVKSVFNEFPNLGFEFSIVFYDYPNFFVTEIKSF